VKIVATVGKPVGRIIQGRSENARNIRERRRSTRVNAGCRERNGR